MADLIGPRDMVSRIKRIGCISKRKNIYIYIQNLFSTGQLLHNYVISPTPSPSNSRQAPIVPKLDNAIPLDKFISYAYYPLDSYK